ncbi:ubiquinol-cytochrome C reductase hinge protein-domain-containing protein, partial [Absidia repens]
QHPVEETSKQSAEDEIEDSKEQIMEECTKSCSQLKKHLDECNERVANGSNEDCVEEFFHFLQCADVCAAPKLFSTTK